MSKTKITQVEGLNFTETIAEIPFGGDQILTLKTGKLAKQANGTVMAQIGGTVVMANVVCSDKPTDRDFFPLMVDYREKFYAAGKIPGGFLKRETRPTDNEALRARLTDRTLRPMFPKGFMFETIVSLTVLAIDNVHPSDLVAMCAASAALHVSDIPFEQPIAGVRTGMKDGNIVVNPTTEEIADLDMDLIVAGHADAINMVEAGAKEVSEAEVVSGLEAAHAQIKIICDGINKLREKAGKDKFEFEAPTEDEELKAKIAKMAPPHIKEVVETHDKFARANRVRQAIDEIMEELGEDYAERKAEVRGFFDELDEISMRNNVTKKGFRADGRKTSEIRPIWSEIDSLPSVHGSAIFTRGQTQALAVCTLGTSDDSQMIDDITGKYDKNFFLHYNFPPFSVGEARPARAPGRREIGHGALAERALRAVMPDESGFPYTVRMVIEILESNGSSSMATVCSSSMAMMDAGVPLARPVAGIAMGLIVGDSEKETAILSDIQGIEDHCGDMDFKVCGTSEGITALQMDIKIAGVTSEMLAKALDQARQGRMFILEKMSETIETHREEMKPQTPRMTIIKIPQTNIGDIIGSGGKTIRALQEESNAKIDIQEDGTVYIAAANQDDANKCIKLIDDIIRDIMPGEIIEGEVVRTIEAGAIVKLTATKDGMIHISEIENFRIAAVEDVLNVGDKVRVKVLDVDKVKGRIKLSRKALLEGGDSGSSNGGGNSAPRPPRNNRPSDAEGDGEEKSGGDGDDRRQQRRRRPRPPRKRED